MCTYCKNINTSVYWKYINACSYWLCTTPQKLKKLWNTIKLKLQWNSAYTVCVQFLLLTLKCFANSLAHLHSSVLKSVMLLKNTNNISQVNFKYGKQDACLQTIPIKIIHMTVYKCTFINTQAT